MARYFAFPDKQDAKSVMGATPTHPRKIFKNLTNCGKVMKTGEDNY
jgi:hypothetical protein